MRQSSLTAFFGAARPSSSSTNENDKRKKNGINEAGRQKPTPTLNQGSKNRKRSKSSTALGEHSSNKRKGTAQRNDTSQSTNNRRAAADSSRPQPPPNPVRERHDAIMASLVGSSSNNPAAMHKDSTTTKANAVSSTGQSANATTPSRVDDNESAAKTRVEEGHRADRGSSDSDQHLDPTQEDIKTDSQDTGKQSDDNPRLPRKRNRVRNSQHEVRSSAPMLHWIHQRSLLGRGGVKAPIHPLIPWSLAHWLFLSDMGNTASVRRMSWDKDGVLLAMVSAQRLIVYDWDSVVAADRQGRNRHCLRPQESSVPESNRTCFGVPPTIKVTLPSPFTASSSLGCLSLEWNPFNPDEIAVLHLDGNVCIYDLGIVLEWMETRQSDPSAQSWSESTNAPCRNIRLEQSMCGKTIGNLTFVGRAHLIVSMGSEIACYALSTSSKKSSARLVWKWTWQTVTSVISVMSDQILIGSQKGSLALVDWRKVHRPAFSSRAIPTVVKQWSTSSMLSKQSFPDHFGGMGICHLQNDGKTDSCDRVITSPRLLRLSWHTPCGWILSGQLDLQDRVLHSIEVIHSTTPVSICDHTGAPVRLSNLKAKWSLPATGSVVSTGTTNALVVAKVPSVVQILPHHDQRILEARPRIERIAEPPKLVHFSRETGRTQEITLAAKSKSWSVTAMAVHPSQEWLIVGTNDTANHGLRIYNARPKS